MIIYVIIDYNGKTMKGFQFCLHYIIIYVGSIVVLETLVNDNCNLVQYNIY